MLPFGIGRCVKRASGPTSWATTWSETDTGDFNPGTAYTYRSSIPASKISTSGSYIRVTFEAGTGVQILGVSIGEQSGTSLAGTVSAPVQMYFTGNAGVTLTSGQSAVTDTLTFSLDETKPYLITVAFGDPANMRYRDDAAYMAWYQAGAQHLTQSGAGFSAHGTFAVCAWKIEVGS